MLNICYYLSDYGYGHASRGIAVMRGILEALGDVRLYAKAGFPFEFLKSSLPASAVEAVRTENDIGVAFRKGTADVDAAATGKMLDEWVSSWDGYIKREKAFLDDKDISLVLSDITPQPFIAASELGLPAVAISNFTWHYIFNGLLGKTDATEELKRAYGKAHSALVLPFNEEMGCIRKKTEVGLVSRRIGAGRQEMRARLGVADDDLLVFLGIGKSFDTGFLGGNVISGKQNVRLMVSSHVGSYGNGAIRIPGDVTETQDYIAACDLVVSKAGYSVVSEAVKGKVPIMLFKRNGFREDDLMQRDILRNGIGNVISAQSFLNRGWVNDLVRLEKYKAGYDALEGRLARDGTAEVVKHLAGIMGL